MAVCQRGGESCGQFVADNPLRAQLEERVVRATDVAHKGREKAHPEEKLIKPRSQPRGGFVMSEGVRIQPEASPLPTPRSSRQNGP